MKTSYDCELIDSLANEVSNGAISIEDSSDRYFSELAAAFPLSGSRIEWARVPGAVVAVTDSENELNSFIEFFDRVCEGVDNSEMLTYVGDGLTNCAYVGSLGIVRNHLAAFLSIPHHHYFIASDCKWCIVFTFEGDMAYGRAPSTT